MSALVVSLPAVAQEPDPVPPKDSTLALNPPPLQPQPPFQIDRSWLVKIEPQLLKKLLTANGQPVPFIVYLKARANLPAAVAAVSPGVGAQGRPDPLAERVAVINALQQTAQSTQGNVLQILSRPPARGVGGQSLAAFDIRPLWIVNAVAARGSLDTVLALAAQPEVEIIRLDKQVKLNPATAPLSALNRQTARPNRQTPAWGVSKIRADLVHNALGIDGAGVVVANIDSGVDWLHPALQSKYRGYTGPGHLPNHAGNWFDATGENAVYPVDSNGHGTHTMGTMVGGNGVGVAPGAQWIAARAFNSAGVAQNSWLHAAFQWILAPNGNPALAPHIVNNSWGSDNGASTEFAADVQALQTAGIFPIFSAGNNGPNAGTVGSPGSLNTAFAVGATTIDDEIATFSSRGPSPWGQIKPEVSAPGKGVYSTLPGGAYGNLDGTSMAAPHAAGLAALLLQASPALAGNTIANIIKNSAIPLGSPIPNNVYGWGRIDAYNAVMSVAAAGVLQGAVTNAANGTPIAGALVQMTPNPGGATVSASTNSSGAYTQGLAPNSYDVNVSAFGYQPQMVSKVLVNTGTTTIQNFSLTPQPTGVLAGTVKDKGSNAPLAATLSVDGAPASANTNPADGSYSLQLPAGVYTVTVVAARHRITQAVNINITAGATTTQHFLLDSAPSILLVDSGRWYQESEISFYRQALTDALYPYELKQIANPFGAPNDIPSAATLANYDIVIWSAPFDSPGYIGADDELASFLNGGGKLLLSGQDVAYYDSFWFWYVAYLKNLLKVSFVEDAASTANLNGVSGQPFNGLSLSISGGDGADNQFAADVIANNNADFAGPLLNYADDRLAALHVGLCVPYRAMFFAFGFEAINSRANRSEVMGKAIDWLMQTPAPVGVELTPITGTLVGNFGATVTHTIRARNTGTGSDVISLTPGSGAPYNWPVSGVPPSVSLGSCQSQQILAQVQLPGNKTWHISDTFTITAQSNANPAVTGVVTRTTKTPAPLLLVDDDRWYSFANEFKEALASNNIPYDYYQVPKSWSGPEPPSPSLATLQMYPMAVWYVAYDWFQPLTPAEEARLGSYLNGGGRLFFSGQDYLYRHLLNHNNSYQPFAQNYLGIQAHTEDYTSTLTIGQTPNPVGAYLGPYNLTFPPGYNNWTDALTPTTTAQIATRGQAGQPNSLTNAGIGSGGKHWHTTFLAYGPELLDSSARARLMQRSVGWLSWLGSSTVQAQADSVADGSTIIYTAVITNNGWDPIGTATFTATFPGYLTPGSASPGVNLAGGNFVWSDSLGVNSSKSFTYTAQINGSLPLGAVISQTSWLYYPEHNILFDRVAAVNAAPNLSASMMSVTPNQNINQNNVLSYTITLKNSGPVDAALITTTGALPAQLDMLGVDLPGSGAVITGSNSFTWTTALPKGQQTTLTFQARVNSAGGGSIVNTAYVEDGVNPTLPLSAQATFKVTPLYLPLIVKHK